MQDHHDDNHIRHDIYSTSAAGMQAENVAEEFFKLFWSDAQKHVKQGGFKHIREDGKHVFERPNSIALPLSAIHVQQHLAGVVRVSSIPLCQNDTCVWGGLDVDLYGATPDKSLDVTELRQRIAALPLPLYYGTSKSGGGHIYLFADAPVAASTLRKTLQSIAKALGLVVTGKKKNTEVYPKQDTTSSSAEFGNSMELPYCGMKYDGSLDTGIWVYGQGAVSIEIFLRNVKKASIADIKNFITSGKTSNGHDKDARELHVLVNKLTNDTRELLQDPHHPNRSDACFTIITEMITRGFSDEEIFLVLHSYPNGPAKHYTDHKSKPTDDIKRIRLKYKRNSFEWPQRTIWTKNGGPQQNVHNVALVLRSPDLNGLFVYDEMERRVKVTECLPDVFDDEEPRPKEFPYGFRDVDCIHMETWFQTIGLSSIKQDTVGQGIYYVAMDRAYHPVKQYLGLLKWDGRRRLNTWLSRALGVTPDRYHATIGRKFLLSMVARIYRPGCKVDYMLVQVGRQGARKSTVASILAGRWFSDDLPDLRNGKDAALHLNGKWLIEMPELSAIRKQDNEHTKSFISRQTDKYRPPYGRLEVEEPRQCVFFGTTNKEDFLNDETGARRYWPVKVVKVNLEWLRTNRDQLFAEAVVRFNAGENWWPTDIWEEQFAKPQQDKYQESDEVWEHDIEEYLTGMEQCRIRMNTLFMRVLGFKENKDILPAHILRLRKILLKLGWEKGRDKVSNYWFKR
jgi:hypothetical protein